MTKPANTAQQVVEWIVAQISSRNMTPGQRLVESAIARDLGVGTVPVREALRMLAGDGVVEITHNRGARIRVMSPKQISDTLKAIIALADVAIDELERRPELVDGILPDLWTVTHRIQEDIKNRDVPAMLEGTQRYMLIFLQAAGNWYILDSVQKVHLDCYAQQVLRFVGYHHLHKSGINHIPMTKAIEHRNFKRFRKLFKDNSDRAIEILEDRAAWEENNPDSLPPDIKARKQV